MKRSMAVPFPKVFGDQIHNLPGTKRMLYQLGHCADSQSNSYSIGV